MIRRKALWNCLSQIVGTALAIRLGVPPLGSGRAEAESLISLTTTGNLVTFDISTPGTTDSSGAISGLLAGEVLLAIDRRPATGLLYGLGSTSRIDTRHDRARNRRGRHAVHPGRDTDRVRIRLQPGP
jgi:hypothetical protein